MCDCAEWWMVELSRTGPSVRGVVQKHQLMLPPLSASALS